MKLFISGQGEFQAHRHPPITIRVKKFLDGSKDGELFRLKQVADRLKVCPDSVEKALSTLKSYSHKIGGTRYWGKPATIKQLIKETK